MEMRLCDLKPGETATVRALLHSDAMRCRLQDIGLLPGSSVTCLWRSPQGDPTAYRIRQAVIALRREDSAAVLVSI